MNDGARVNTKLRLGAPALYGLEEGVGGGFPPHPKPRALPTDRL